MQISIRQARESDLETIVSVSDSDDLRLDDLRRAVQAGTCVVAERERVVLGYAVLTYHFFENGMIELVYVLSQHRCGAWGRASSIIWKPSAARRNCSPRQISPTPRC